MCVFAFLCSSQVLSINPLSDSISFAFNTSKSRKYILMDSLSIFPDGEWDSLSRMFFADEEPDFTLQHSVPLNEHINYSSFGAPVFYPSEEKNTNVISGIDESLFYLLQSTNTNLHSFSEDHDHHINNPYNCNDSSNYMPFTNNPACDESTFSGFPRDMILDEEQESDGIDREAASVPVKKLHMKRKVETPDLEAGPSKKSRGSSGDANKIKKTNAQSKKKPPPRGNDEEVVTDNGLKVQTSSSCSSESESNATQEQNGGATADSKGPAATSPTAKARASRGSASDPQSLYARKRRERINERLRILQGLVPNGTKVDISTMLEEAVHYVKFLQHQIKLLSSDDMWMYAPIAYNGIDIGLDRKAAYPFL